MNRYTDINKKTLFAEGKILKGRNLVPYRKKTRKTKNKVNYQVRYYFLIFSFLFITFSYVVFKVFQDENSIFREIYNVFFDTPLAIPASNSASNSEASSISKVQVTPSINESLPLSSSQTTIKPSNPSESLTPQSTTLTKALNNAVVSLYLPQFSREKNAIHFIPIPQKIEYASSKNLLKKTISSLIGFRSEETTLKNFFSSNIRLRNLFIENETLVLDFNRFLENSKYGYKGLEIRLQEILWTIFNLDKSVFPEKVFFISILIEGERKEKLGGDGLILKPFYSRKDLKSKMIFN